MVFFFFQAADGIRDHCVTGVQTCALPISESDFGRGCIIENRDHGVKGDAAGAYQGGAHEERQIGRASCRERV